MAAHTKSIVWPNSSSVRKYLSTVILTDLEKSSSKSYVPILALPKEQTSCVSVIERIRKLGQDSVLFSENENAFMYVIGEMVDNVYQHSLFNNAFVMAQNYKHLGFLEIGFIDDGITIPGCFNKHGLSYDEPSHYQAIIDALSGLSTKEGTQRGYGLSSSMNLFKALDGEALVVSGCGAVYLYSKDALNLRLKRKNMLNGTLITLRVRDTRKKINIYDYIE